MMKNKVIFELKLNDEDSIIACEKSNYGTCYEDSRLFISVNGKKTKIVESSFCYGFGLEMYYRVFNIKDFYEVSNFKDSLKIFYDTLTYNDEYNPDDSNSEAYFKKNDFDAYDYDFVNGNSSNKLTSLILYRNESWYKLLFVEILENESKNHEVTILNEYQISEETFVKWKTIIKTEWERRVVIEGDKMAEANSRRKSTKEEWERYFLFMRRDK